MNLLIVTQWPWIAFQSDPWSFINFPLLVFATNYAGEMQMGVLCKKKQKPERSQEVTYDGKQDVVVVFFTQV